MFKYKRVRQIGKGSFGAAVLVSDLKPPCKKYVVKTVDVGRLKPSERDEAMKEVRLLASFDHPHIITYRESFMEAGALHIVMDFAEDGDLHTLLKERKGSLFDESQARRF